MPAEHEQHVPAHAALERPTPAMQIPTPPRPGRLAPPASWLCLVLALGCGGKVAFDDGGSGGTSSATSMFSVGASTASTSKAASNASGGPVCPDVAPVEGEACTSPGLACALAHACCQPTATCLGGKWSISVPACGQPCIACGPSLSCSIEAVCVVTSIADSAIYRCDDNLCRGEPPSCACAGPLCTGHEGEQCVSASGTEVDCDTPTDG